MNSDTITNSIPAPGTYTLVRDRRTRQRIELIDARPIAECEGWTVTKGTESWVVIRFVPADSIIGTTRIWACAPEHLIAD